MGRIAKAQPSVVIRATEVVAALSAHKLAAVADQPMRAGRANLAVMLHGLSDVDGTVRTTL